MVPRKGSSRRVALLSHVHQDLLPSTEPLRVVDAFVVKYNATAGQSFLKPHRDGSVVGSNHTLSMT